MHATRVRHVYMVMLYATKARDFAPFDAAAFDAAAYIYVCVLAYCFRHRSIFLRRCHCYCLRHAFTFAIIRRLSPLTDYHLPVIYRHNGLPACRLIRHRFHAIHFPPPDVYAIAHIYDACSRLRLSIDSIDLLPSFYSGLIFSCRHMHASSPCHA